MIPTMSAQLRRGLMLALAFGTAIPLSIQRVVGQAGWICPETGVITIVYEGEIYVGQATMVEGVGLEATYRFDATSSSGHVIGGTAEADLLACLLNWGGEVPLNDVRIEYWLSSWPDTA